MAEYIYTDARTWYSPSAFIITLVNIVFGVIEFLIAARIVLELLGAESGSSFVAWLYGVSGNFVAPFSGAFPSWALGGGYVLDLSAIFAMICYAIIGWIVMRLLVLLFSALYAVRV